MIAFAAHAKSFKLFPAATRMVIAALVSSSLAIGTTGCATGPDGEFVWLGDDISVLMEDSEGLTPVEKRQLERVQRYARMRSQGAGLGALAGGAAGAAGGAAAAGSDGLIIGAVGGILAGAQLGYLVGAYLANLNDEAVDRRDDLNVQLAAAQKAVSETRQAVADNREIVKAERRRIDRLNREYRAGRITQAQYRDQINKLETKITIVQESLRAAENDTRAMQATIDSQQANHVDTRRLAAQKTRMEQEVIKLRHERDALLAAVASIPAEIGAPSA